MNRKSTKFPTRFAAALGSVALAMLLLAGSAFAASQVTMGPNDSPSKALPLDTAAHTIAPGQAQWYRFELSGSNGNNAVLSLPGGSHSGLQFQVYAVGQTNDWTSEDPTGVGNIEDNGDLAWVNQIDGSGGMWYVRVINTNAANIAYQFNLTGATLVALPGSTTPSTTTPGGTTPSTTTPGSTTPSTTTPGSTTTGNTTPPSVTPRSNLTPATAAPLDMQLHAIVANQSVWYRFTLHDTKGQYSILSLPGAARSGVQFEIYSADQINDWQNQDPAGRSNVDDNNNLTWAVQSDTADTWYVRVLNNTAANQNFQFTTIGPFSAP